jgi:hypothetical protein
VTTSLAPDHKPELGRGGAFEGHRRASVGFHRRRANRPLLGGSAGSGSTWCRQLLQQTISRTWAAAALPSVIGGPGVNFIPTA